MQRHECKYVVPESVALRLLHGLRTLLAPDPHAEQQPRHTYPICSLYLDSSDLTFYRESVEGQRSRAKLRVRSYADDPATPVIAEVKRRADGVVSKLRCPIPRVLLPRLLAGDLLEVPEANDRQRHSLREFTRLMQLGRATPRVLVRYDRQAYVGSFEPDVRVTVDRRLRAAPARGSQVLLAASGFHDVLVDKVVVELKFTDRCPGWLLRAIQRFELKRRSFSKYCHALARVESRARVARVSP